MPSPEFTQAAFPFRHRLRVRYAEIDAQGVVFNGHYLTWFDVALTEACRWPDFDWLAEMERSGKDFQLVRALVEYKRAVRFDEEVDVACRIVRLGRSSVSWELAVFGLEGAADLRATGEIVWVYSDLKAGRSAELPADFRARLQGAGLVAETAR